MAPELAVSQLVDLAPDSMVLDPMVGSGTVVRSAAVRGHQGIGVDLDPLAILMTRVATSPVECAEVAAQSSVLLHNAKSVDEADLVLPWIDDDLETQSFVNRWFAEPQRSDLRRLAYVLQGSDDNRVEDRSQLIADVLRLALSRIIITKDRGASLARDVSHSRPHKVADRNDFEVFPSFQRSVHQIVRALERFPPPGRVDVEIGDARALCSIESESIDLVLTSPPYLNAIDYMRGHRFALVWLGYRMADLRQIRAKNIGAERGPDGSTSAYLEIQKRIMRDAELPGRYNAIIARYSADLYLMMSEIKRVVKRSGAVTIVIGDCFLRGSFIRNSDGVAEAARMTGLVLKHQYKRDLPMDYRYLPLPSTTDVPLGKRLRTESILTFVRL